MIRQCNAQLIASVLGDRFEPIVNAQIFIQLVGERLLVGAVFLVHVRQVRGEEHVELVPMAVDESLKYRGISVVLRPALLPQPEPTRQVTGKQGRQRDARDPRTSRQQYAQEARVDRKSVV